MVIQGNETDRVWHALREMCQGILAAHYLCNFRVYIAEKHICLKYAQLVAFL